MLKDGEGDPMRTAACEITRIQLCGQFAVVAGGQRIDGDLPGKRGRLLVGYLAAHRQQPTSREELVEALWPGKAGDPAAATLTVLLSKIRATLGADAIRGRSALQLALPAGALLDTETAAVSLHQAESAVALSQWRRAWGTSMGALYTAKRRFLAEFEASWISDEREHLELVHQRALTCYVEACLGIGGTELPAAERAARILVSRWPLYETGHRVLMQALAARGDTSSALRTYELLRVRLAEELGVDPDPQLRDLHQHLLTARTRPLQG
jgi:SARP family transcriptional regulator, regulator of embCAB operon